MDTSAAREQIAQLLRMSQQLKEAVGASATHTPATQTLNAGDWGEAEVHLDTVIAALGVAHLKAEVQEETGSWEDDWW